MECGGAGGDWLANLTSPVDREQMGNRLPPRGSLPGKLRPAPMASSVYPFDRAESPGMKERRRGMLRR